MGLDCSHDAFHGAYSAFNRLRQEAARAIGGSFPPHFLYDDEGQLVKGQDGLAVFDEDLDGAYFYSGEDYSKTTHPGLFEFLEHSDCDGEISPAMCLRVASDLEELLPQVQALGSVAAGHILNRGGYVEVLRKFIAGCREAAVAGEPLRFS
jgi:hypothetical protein